MASPYKAMLEDAGKKISLKPQPALKKLFATAIGSRDMKKLCIASSSSSKDTDDEMLEGSSESEDLENDPLADIALTVKEKQMRTMILGHCIF